jgi:NADP-dependent 3-hydroxy acid dehydrogenase YdfG
MDRLVSHLLEQLAEHKLANSQLRRQCKCSQPVSVVLGGSSGIGRGIAEKMAAEGFVVIIVARESERLKRAAWEINRSKSCSGLVLPCTADATQTATAVKAIQRVLATIDSTCTIALSALVMAHGFFAWDKDIRSKELMVANFESKHLVLSSLVALGVADWTTSVIVIGSQAGAPGFKEEMVRPRISPCRTLSQHVFLSGSERGARCCR